MNHYADKKFWRYYHELPTATQKLADKSFTLLKSNPRHPSLQFKNVGRYWSARVGQHHRAVAVEASDGFLWFWIGSHANYDKLIS